jgi:hypothetical protein
MVVWLVAKECGNEIRARFLRWKSVRSVLLWSLCKRARHPVRGFAMDKCEVCYNSVAMEKCEVCYNSVAVEKCKVCCYNGFAMEKCEVCYNSVAVEKCKVCCLGVLLWKSVRSVIIV